MPFFRNSERCAMRNPRPMQSPIGGVQNGTFSIWICENASRWDLTSPDPEERDDADCDLANASECFSKAAVGPVSDKYGFRLPLFCGMWRQYPYTSVVRVGWTSFSSDTWIGTRHRFRSRYPATSWWMTKLLCNLSELFSWLTQWLKCISSGTIRNHNSISDLTLSAGHSCQVHCSHTKCKTSLTCVKFITTQHDIGNQFKQRNLD